MKNLDIEKAKKTWEGKGITNQGITVINGWIDQLAKAGVRYEAYAKMAYCTADVRGSLANLKNTIDLVNKDA